MVQASVGFNVSYPVVCTVKLFSRAPPTSIVVFLLLNNSPKDNPSPILSLSLYSPTKLYQFTLNLYLDFHIAQSPKPGPMRFDLLAAAYKRHVLRCKTKEFRTFWSTNINTAKTDLGRLRSPPKLLTDILTKHPNAPFAPYRHLFPIRRPPDPGSQLFV